LSLAPPQHITVKLKIFCEYRKEDLEKKDYIRAKTAAAL
jgi:hypothetical protein